MGQGQDEGQGWFSRVQGQRMESEALAAFSVGVALLGDAMLGGAEVPGARWQKQQWRGEGADRGPVAMGAFLRHWVVLRTVGMSARLDVQETGEVPWGQRVQAVEVPRERAQEPQSFWKREKNTARSCENCVD